MRIAIIGGGGWGLALAKLLNENNHHVLVWEYNPTYLELLKNTHSNPNLLKDVQLPDSIGYTSSFTELAEADPEIIILATPAQFVRKTVQSAPASLWLSPRLQAIVNVAKGIEEGSLLTLDAVEFPPQ